MESEATPPSDAFARAVALMDEAYDAGAIHILAEVVDGRWVNRYTSIAYGRRQDMISVPAVLDVDNRGAFVCLRQLLSKDDGGTFASAAVVGIAHLGNFEIDYDLETPITGFRPASVFHEFAARSFFGTSMWTREHIGRLKCIGSIDLLGDDLWRLSEELDFLRQTRWTPIPLLTYPEKIGDMDEWWPTPIELYSSGGDGVKVSIGRNILEIDSERISVHGWLLRDGLLVDTTQLSGAGPHHIETTAAGSDLTLYADGISFDGNAVFYVRQITTRMDILTGATWNVPQSKGRPQMRFPMGSATSQTIKGGTPPPPSVRPDAWEAGRKYRANAIRSDAERVYDPDSDPKSIESAFADLRIFGSEQQQPRIAVLDPYALEESALQAIIVSATRNGRASVIDVYSEYQTGTKQGSTDASEQQTHRERTRSAAHAVAQRLATQAGVKIRFFRAERLHDRFLLVGDRIWHVGPSFNKLGEQFSAIIEMHDHRRIAQVKAFMDRAKFDGETS